jgi:hypothetical protein
LFFPIVATSLPVYIGELDSYINHTIVNILAVKQTVTQLEMQDIEFNSLLPGR